MKKKYIIFYYLMAVLVILTFILIRIFGLTKGYTVDAEPFGLYILLVLNFLMVLTNMYFEIKKYELKVDSLKVPITFLTFYIFIVILVLIMDRLLLIPTLEYDYYYGFVLFNYLFLNIYTICSYNKTNKKKNK